ncbi:MAG: Hsp70 family protein [Selenomonadaceae bacterium]|nr:Hsp70 family protein [Selenomonadaceae bacterium]
MAKFVGIDFGACNIKTAVWRGKGARIVSLSQNVEQNYIPNVVLYDITRDKKVEKKIGDPAKDEQDPENSVEYVKRKLELTEWSKNIPNLQRDVSALEAATDIFYGIGERLCKKLNCELNDLNAVITVPVCSSGLQRSRIYQAAKTAGIAVEAVITEPFAAMFSLYDLFDDNEDANVLIFDFGGSTLDLSLLSVEHDDGIRIEELASAGLAYGGIDVDEAILSEIISVKYAAEIKEIKANDDTMDQAKTTRELCDLVTSLKEKLFEDDNSSSKKSCTFYGSSKFYEFELTSREMVSLFERHNLKEKIYALLDELFSQTYLNKNEVTQVKTFGGTSRMKYVLDILTEYFGADVFDSDDYEWEEEAIADVAAGAAHYLAIRQEQSDDIEIISNTPFSLGIAKGQSFKKYLDYSPPYGVRTKRIPLPWKELTDSNYKVSVYQSFADSENVEIGGKDGAIYAGSVTVRPNLYQAKDGILLEMELVDSGHLRMIFSEMRAGENNPIEVEEQIIDLQSEENI